MDRCDRCKHQDSCVCVPYGCECFEIDLSKHDSKIRADAIDKFADIMSDIKGMCGRYCPVNCNWGTTTSCKNMCKKWLIEQLKQKGNE